MRNFRIVVERLSEKVGMELLNQLTIGGKILVVILALMVMIVAIVGIRNIYKKFKEVAIENKDDKEIEIFEAFYSLFVLFLLLVISMTLILVFVFSFTGVSFATVWGILTGVAVKFFGKLFEFIKETIENKYKIQDEAPKLEVIKNGRTTYNR